ncbi:MAG: hypothetical protein QME81_11915 [bacterium]|nr:hypothetical protein [bacterium]
MGRIITPVLITNALDTSHRIECDVLVDTGASALVLPDAWKGKLGNFPSSRTVKMETADQRIVSGKACGPVEIQIEGFAPIYNEVVFLPMEPVNGGYEPILGYIILEQSQVTVDMVGHRLVPVKYLDLK